MTMQVGSTNNAAFAGTPDPTTQKVSTPSLGQKDFMTLMIAQMRNQNPMEPQDNTQFIAQLATFQTLTAMEEMTVALKALAQVSELASASSLVGRTVSASVPQTNDPETGMPRPNDEVSGVVDRVTFGKEGATVHIGNRAVPADLVSEVR
jgi:flagellar basal-body rod modification protein FlgD